MTFNNIIFNPNNSIFAILKDGIVSDQYSSISINLSADTSFTENGVFDIDNNFFGQYILTTNIIERTYSQITTLIGLSGLKVGAIYKITDRGDRGIFLKAITNNKLSNHGNHLMLCPFSYGALGNWRGIFKYWDVFNNAEEIYEINDHVIWGGYVWKNLNGNTGNSQSQLELNANWEKILKSNYQNDEYKELLFDIVYDFINDRILEQSDKYANTVYFNNFNEPNYIDNSDWNQCEIYRIRNNKCNGFFNNFATGGVICFDNVVLGLIAGNSTAVIAYNQCNSITNNRGIDGVSYCSEITYNKCMDIDNNEVSEKISKNSNNGSIINNVNVLTIINNRNNGDINNNTGNGYSIYSNVFNGGINSSSFGQDIFDPNQEK
jgi:hypothetical protein